MVGLNEVAELVQDDVGNGAFVGADKVGVEGDAAGGAAAAPALLKVTLVKSGHGELVLAEQRQALLQHGLELLRSVLLVPLAQQLGGVVGICGARRVHYQTAADELDLGREAFFETEAILAAQVEVGFAADIAPGWRGRPELLEVGLLTQNPGSAAGDTGLNLGQGYIGRREDVHSLVGVDGDAEGAAWAYLYREGQLVATMGNG